MRSAYECGVILQSDGGLRNKFDYNYQLFGLSWSCIAL